MPGENVCSVCGATFTRPQHVGRHMRSHTGDKPYHCKQCPEKFARSDLLSRHVNKTHGPPIEGEGRGDVKNGIVLKKKGRKPKFTSALAAMSSSSEQPYRPPFSHQPQQRPMEQQQFQQGQNVPYSPHPPFHGALQQTQTYGFAQTQVNPHTGATMSPGSGSSVNGMPMRVGANQANRMAYTIVQENGITSGFEVDNEEEDDDAWIDMPNDRNMNMSNVNPMPSYMMPQQYTAMVPPQSQIPLQMGQQQSSVPLQQYTQQYNNTFTLNNMAAPASADSYMPGFNTSYSPGVVTMQNVLPSSTSTSSPYSFWSGSTPQSSPLRHAMPTYPPPIPEAIAIAASHPVLSSSTSPYDFAESAFPRYPSGSPATAGVDNSRNKGTSPLAPAPAGMPSMGAIPTTYSSVMPAPLVPTGTPIADKVEKIKKRACESCNQSKVKCDFGTPCGKCAARKISCKYPTGRKSSRKLNTSASPLSQSASDGAKLASVSPQTRTLDFQPKVAPTQSQGSANLPSRTADQGGSEDKQFRRASDGYQEQKGHIQGGNKSGERRPSYNPETTESQPGVEFTDAFTREPLLTQRPQHLNAASFLQMRQAQDEDGHSTASGHTFGQLSQAESRRSSMASTFASEDGQQVNNSLPFSTLSLGGSSLMPDGTDVHQWLFNAAGDAASIVDINSGVPDLSPMDQSGFMFESPVTTAPTTYFWQTGAETSDSKPTVTFVPPSNVQNQRLVPPFFARPNLVRGRSNSFPMLYTPRASLEATQYFAPASKASSSGSALEQSALPQDWTAQIRHMATQLNRNGSGTSSLQQVDDALGGTIQSTPQKNEPSPDGGLSFAHPGHPPFSLGRPQPAVLQSANTNAMAKQVLTNRGSLQTLAPERTPSFLVSTPTSEMDGMKWPTALPSKNTPGTLLSPFKMPNHLARPGNKRMPSQTLGPDMRKRQSISLTADDLDGNENLLDAASNQVAESFAHPAVNLSAQLSIRRASMPTWLPDASGSLSYMPMNGIHGNLSSNQSVAAGRAAINHSPAAGMTFYPDLTPTLFDPLPQGFNFNSASNLTTPTMERVAFNIPVEETKPLATWTIQA